MRLRIFAIFIFLILCLTVRGQSPPYWFHFAGSVSNDEGMAIATDNADNVINVGYYSGALNFGTINLTNSGITDGYIVKTSSDGTYLWAIKFGGNSDDRALGVCIDAQNNIYVTGYFTNTAQFGTISLTSSGQQDIFVMKIDPNGTILWANKCGGSDNDIGNGICSDHNGNIIVTGQFRATAQFGSSSLTSMNDPGSGFPSTDIFTTKIDGGGNFLWAKKGSGKYTDRGIDVSCDLSGNIYVTGQFSDTIAFDVVHTNSLFNAIFLIKYNPTGTEQWFNKIGAGSTTLVRSIKVDQNANFYVSGESSVGTIFFGSPNITISNPYTNRVFAAKYNSSGAVQWATANGSDNAISAGDMAIDDSSNVYITGTFNCKLSEFCDFYGQGIFNSIGYKDVFTSRISSAGVWQWARQCGGPANDAATGIDLIGNTPVITGSFNNRFFYTSSPLYLQYEGAGINVMALGAPFCLDTLFRTFLEDTTKGGSDIYFGKAYDLNRTPYDYYNRTNSNCTLPFIGVSIDNGAVNQIDTIFKCTGQILEAVTNTFGGGVGPDTFKLPGPSYFYLWNTFETTPVINATTDGYYGVKLTSIDGCFTSTDSIYLSILPKPATPLISDNFLININALVTNPIILCAPDTIILNASNTGNNIVQWYKNGLIFASGTTATINAPGSFDGNVMAKVIDSNFCISANSVTIDVDVPLDSIHPVIYVPKDTIYICPGEIFNFIVHVYDSIADPLDTATCAMTNANFNWYTVPYLSFFPGCNQGEMAYTPLDHAGNFLITCVINRSSACGGSDQTILTKQITVLMYPPVILTPPIISLNGNDTLCGGSSVTLMATGGNNFTWTGPNVLLGTTGSNLLVSAPGYYCVYVYDTSATGCASHAAACQEIYATPSPQIIVIPGSNVICPGDSVQLITPNAGTYEWIGPQGSFSTNDTAYSNLTGNYYCNVTDSSGCTLSTPTIELIQYTTPSIILTPSNVLCGGDTIEALVTASPFANIYWYEPFNNTNPIQHIDTAGIYVCFTESCNIYREDTIIIYQSTLNATINPSGLINICENDSIALTGNPGMAVYEWFPAGIFTDSIYVSQNGSYYLIVTDQYGCIDTSDTVSVNTLIAPPTPVISGNSPLCEGDSINLISTNITGVNYSWSGPNNFTSTLINPGISNVTVVNSGMYYLTLYNAQCPGLPDSTYIQVDSFPPVFAFVGDSILCEGNNLMLTTIPSFGNAGNWTQAGATIANGSQLMLNTITFAQEGVYVYTINNALCIRRDSITVQVDSLPPAFAINGTTSVCEGDSITLTTIPSFGNQGTWTTPGQQTLFGSILSINPALTSDSGFFVYVISNQQCDRADSIMTAVHSYPSAFSITGNTILCEGDQLSLSTNPGFGNQGFWTSPDNLQTAGSVYTLNPIGINNSGYYLYSINNQQCYRYDSVGVLVNALPQAFNLIGTTPACEGEPISLSTNPDFGNQGTWTFPNNQTHPGSVYTINASTISDSGMYSFSISNQYCSRVDSISIQINSYPAIFFIEGNLTICEGAPIILKTSPDFGNNGSWLLPDNTIANGSTYELQQSTSGSGGNYYFTINNQQCSRTDSVTVFIISCTDIFPNVFTPNGDGINDIFNSINADINIQTIQIFNRWGEKLREIKSAKGWDGMNKQGTQAPAGIYFFIADYTVGINQEQKRTAGQVELIR